MAHFISYASGRAKTSASRLGSKNSGASARVQSWDYGISVTADNENENDVFTIYVNSGSNGSKPSRAILRLSSNDIEQLLNGKSLIIFLTGE